jgi:hypothetical protein
LKVAGVGRQGRRLRLCHIDEPAGKHCQKHQGKQHLKAQQRAVFQLADIIHLLDDSIEKYTDKSPMECPCYRAISYHRHHSLEWAVIGHTVRISLNDLNDLNDLT